MKSKVLADRSSRSSATISQIESREVDGAVTLDTMRQMAEAMESEFVYFIVPKKNLKETKWKQAMKKAGELLNKTQPHIELEDQAVTSNSKQRLESLAVQLTNKGDIW